MAYAFWWDKIFPVRHPANAMYLSARVDNVIGKW
jgi:hypothetical protein